MAAPPRDRRRFATNGLRLGLCCLVVDAPHAFRATTHAYLSRIGREAAVAHLDAIALHNAQTLVDVLHYCTTLGIRAFRIQSQLFPLATHPESGYALDDLPSGAIVRQLLGEARRVAQRGGIRLSFHPDQFVVLNSVRDEVVRSSIAELEWHAELAGLLGVDVICLHGGGRAGGAEEAAERLIAGIQRLSPRARALLAIENDDRCFSAEDLLPVSLATGVPLVLDSHHHRVLPGSLTLAEATELALATWGEREPYFHVSSPRAGWDAGDPRPHADFIDPDDLPPLWLDLGRPLTVDVEAKAKERAVLQLRDALGA